MSDKKARGIPFGRNPFFLVKQGGVYSYHFALKSWKTAAAALALCCIDRYQRSTINVATRPEMEERHGLCSVLGFWSTACFLVGSCSV